MNAPHADEQEFWQLLLRFGSLQPFGQTQRLIRGLSPRDLINSDWVTIAPKRAWYLCEKWAVQGVYGYGVTCDLGWVEPCCPDCGWFGLRNGSLASKIHAPGCKAVA